MAQSPPPTQGDDKTTESLSLDKSHPSPSNTAPSQSAPPPIKSQETPASNISSSCGSGKEVENPPQSIPTTSSKTTVKEEFRDNVPIRQHSTAADEDSSKKRKMEPPQRSKDQELYTNSTTSTSKTVTPSSKEDKKNFMSKRPVLQSNSGGSFVISSVSEGSMDCEATSSKAMQNGSPSTIEQKKNQLSCEGSKEGSSSRVGSKHFTFTESGLKNCQNPPSDVSVTRRQDIIGGTTITLTNPHGSAAQHPHGEIIDQYSRSQPWQRPRSRSPVTTSRRGGRGSPLFFRGKSSSSPPNSRSSTPLNFTSAQASKRPSPSSPEEKHVSTMNSSASYERHQARVRQDRDREMFDKPSAAAAAAAAAAAEASNYLTDQRYLRHPVPASVTPAQRAGGRSQGSTERGRIRQPRDGYESQYYGGPEYHHDYYSTRSQAYSRGGPRQTALQDDYHRPMMKDSYQRIQTFSQSGSSGESQENGLANDSRYKNADPYHHDATKPRYMDMESRGGRPSYGRGSAGETTTGTSRLSPNFTIYHRATSVRRPDDASCSSGGDSSNKRGGTMVIGGSTPIRISHQDTPGRGPPMRERESYCESSPPSHRSGGPPGPPGRSATSGSVSSVFRTNSRDYPHSHRGRMSASMRADERDRNPRADYSRQHEYNSAGQPRTTDSHSSKRWSDEQRRRERFERGGGNERNAPSPSNNDTAPDRYRSTNRSSFDGRVRNSPSLADLPEDSPQRILLSMRTPSVGAGHSFDRSTSKSSPEEDREPKIIKAPPSRPDIQSPPQLTKRNNTSGFADTFFSDSTDGGPVESSKASPMRRDRSFVSSVPSNLHYTNSSGERIEIAPSFSLFNPDSFDSLGDCPQVQKNRGGDNLVSLSALGSIAHVSSSQPGGAGGGDGGQDTAMSGNPSFGALGNMSIGLGTHTMMNMSRSESMGFMFSLSGANPSFGGVERSPQRLPSTLRRDDTTGSSIHKASSSSQHHYSGRGDQDKHGDDRAPAIRENRSLTIRSRHSSLGRSSSSPSAQRNNSYGSSNSYSTNGSGPHIFYANICVGLIGGPNNAEAPSIIPGFYHSLIHMRQAYASLTFLLPGLKMALERDSQNCKLDIFYDPEVVGKMLPDGTRCPKDIPKVSPLSKEELINAKRRVVSAVCAFGGTNVKQGGYDSEDNHDEKTKSNDEDEDNFERRSKRQRPSYDDVLASRYYENPDENRLSWDFEEIPPVISEREEDLLRKQMKERQAGVDGNNPSSSSPVKDGNNKNQTSPSSPTKTTKDSSSPSSKTGQPKMRYRCKLCGQPKQNHVCPYQSSLQRSIGLTIYPSLNAFTADEPGDLAPPLIDMNNFVSDDGSPAGRPDTEWSASSPVSPTSAEHLPPLVSSSLYHGEMEAASSPYSHHHSRLGIKSSSVVSSSSPFERHVQTPSSSVRKPSPSELRSLRSLPRKRHVGQVSKSSSKEEQEEMLFVESMELKHEQFRDLTMDNNISTRNLTITKRESSSDSCSTTGSYCYPLLPLPYSQRKGLSDTLFSLSKEVQHLTDECASVLKEAREKDMWDLAVAELMTQVMAVLHCPLGDNTLDGLRRHLLTLGIAC